jgi:hypothetical protein
MDLTLIGLVVVLGILLTVVARFARAIGQMARSPELRALLLIVLATLLAGMFFYHRVEGWTFLDALYFSVITLTTVGYGDFSPQTPLGKIFTMIYILAGLGLLAAFVTTIANIAFKRVEPDGTAQTSSGEAPDDVAQ